MCVLGFVGVFGLLQQLVGGSDSLLFGTRLALFTWRAGLALNLLFFCCGYRCFINRRTQFAFTLLAGLALFTRSSLAARLGLGGFNLLAWFALLARRAWLALFPWLAVITRLTLFAGLPFFARLTLLTRLALFVTATA